MDNNNMLAAWPVVSPGIAGAVFGVGWWFWVDAVVCSAAAVPFLQYLPGTCAVSPILCSVVSVPSVCMPPKARILNRSWALSWLGFFATFAALMFNCVNREDIGDSYYSPYDDSEWRWGKVWNPPSLWF
jgi:hypothetical protein